MNERLLIVDDEKENREILRFALDQAGFRVVDLESADEALRYLKGPEKPDLIILDILLSGLNGDQLCRLIKENSKTASIPILALTATQKEVELLDLGFDDFVPKPIQVDRLLARVRALLRRSRDQGFPGGILKVGGIALDRERHRVVVQGTEIHLTPTEFRLLELFLSSNGRLLTYSSISQALWDVNKTIYKHSLETHINNLRNKLGMAAQFIETVTGVGYRLRNPN